MGTSAAARQKLYEQRRRDGLVVVPALVVEVDLVEALRQDGFLNGNDPSRHELAEAFSKWTYATLMRQERERWPEL